MIVARVPFAQATVHTTKGDKALGLLGHDTAQVVFVDDWPGHVQAAGTLG
jgi:hypothetical protein